jgi:hypothetical protein
MKTDGKIKKAALIRARCSLELKLAIEQVAAIQQLDSSDIVRMACNHYVLKFKQPSLIPA